MTTYNFQNLPDRLLELFVVCGVLEEEQIIRFLSSEFRPIDIRHELDRMEIQHMIIPVSDSGRYRFLTYKLLRKSDENRRVRAFWPLAYMGSASIDHFTALAYPHGWFVHLGTTENQSYNFYVIEDEKDVFNAQLHYNSNTLKDKDGKEIKLSWNVAIIRFESQIEHLYGSVFDFCCLLDRETHAPKYISLTE